MSIDLLSSRVGEEGEEMEKGLKRQRRFLFLQTTRLLPLQIVVFIQIATVLGRIFPLFWQGSISISNSIDFGCCDSCICHL